MSLVRYDLLMSLVGYFLLVSLVRYDLLMSLVGYFLLVSLVGCSLGVIGTL